MLGASEDAINLGTILLVVFAIALILGSMTLASDIEDTVEKAEELVLEEDWTTYVNGVVVDGKGVTVKNYKVEIDEDNKIIKLTTRSNSTTQHIPIPVVIPVSR